MPYFHGSIYQPNCQVCPLKNDTKVYPDGPIPAEIAFVGKFPGKHEIIEGRTAVGPSGKLLWLLAGQAGISREMVWCTNVLYCAPRKVKLANSAVIPYNEVIEIAMKCCKGRILNELAYVNPKVIVPLGTEPLKIIQNLPKPKIYSYRGAIMELDIAQRAMEFNRFGS